ncbi:protein ABCI12, chloroplastic isoform X1 [Benincasa hispida]|uniref:protein ABCI12, chloroplastic isoform X1 n=1 Tax=Benincasa hispida TaxID=102211 RepID=UPI0019020399|nr:protein ABCI12, chloroplastic isoform X1 [Benincasa hispida]
MNFPYSSFRTVAYSLPSPVHIPKALVPPIFTSISALNSGKVGPSVYWKIILKPVGNRSFRVRASKNDDAGTEKWLKWLPNGALAADKMLRLIAGATASPISQFISSPVTFLHSVDPRIKLVWLLALVVLPARSNITIRFGLVIFLAFLSIWILPTELWKDQLGRVSILSGILFVMLGLGADGVPPLIQSRTPPPGMIGLPELPSSLGGYSYLIAKLGPLTFTRKGLSIASTSACLTFVVFQSASLCLTTTAPEQLAFAIRWFMLPLGYFGVPVAEITLTLLLSLRFVSLVFDEVRNVALGVVSRRINWQMLTTMETVDGKHPETLPTFFFTYLRRIFKNIFTHAEQISQAMIVRGFRGDSSNHKLYFLSNSSSRMANILSLLCLFGVISASFFFDNVII